MSLSGPAHRAGPDLPSRPMSTFPLGGRRVRRSGYGAMHLAGPWAVNPPADRESAIGVLRAAVAAGVDHIDTAQYYGPDVVNDLIREALHPYPPELAIVSKVGVFRDAGHDARQLRQGIEDNLRSLRVSQLAAVNLRRRQCHGAGRRCCSDELRRRPRRRSRAYGPRHASCRDRRTRRFPRRTHAKKAVRHRQLSPARRIAISSPIRSSLTNLAAIKKGSSAGCPLQQFNFRKS